MKVKLLKRYPKKYLNKTENSPITNKNNSEDTNKIVTLPWIPITGPKLRKTFKKKNNIELIFTSSSTLKLLLC